MLLTIAGIQGFAHVNQILPNSQHLEENIHAPCEQLISEFESIDSNLQELRLRAETDIGYFVARLSAKEAQRAQKESEQVNQLNCIVFVLGPMSTLASILAIQERQKYILFFLAA